MKKLFLFIVLLLIVFICSIYTPIVSSQSVCIPRMIVVTIGDNSIGNPLQSFTTELGCVENVFTDVQGYIAINTPIRFEHVTQFELVDYSSDGYIIGYQITKLINTTEVLYIITYDHATRFIRLKESQFEVQAIAE